MGRQRPWGEGLWHRAVALRTPVFAVAVALLLLNDRVLKAAYPGVATGKLSDVAGVVVIGMLATVMIGRRPGIIVTAVGFAAIKVLPGMAELVAPVLGGVTRRDSTDLVALVALWPLDRYLRHDLHRRRGAAPIRRRTGGPAPDPRTAASERARAVARAIGTLLAVGTAVLATTATSALPEPAVQELRIHDGAIHALVAEHDDGTWFRTDDGGRTWSSVPSAAAPTTTQDPDRSLVGPPPSGGTTPATAPPATEPLDEALDEPVDPPPACLPSRTCYAVRGGDRIVRTTPGQAAVEERALTPSERSAVCGPCLTSIVAEADGSGDVVLTNIGTGGILRRTADGWEQVRLGGAKDPLDPEGARRSRTTLDLLGAAAGLLLFIPIVAWGRGARRLFAVVIALIGWGASGAIALGQSALTSEPYASVAPTLLVGEAGTLLLVLAVVFLGRRATA